MEFLAVEEGEPGGAGQAGVSLMEPAGLPGAVQRHGSGQAPHLEDLQL